MWDEDGLVMSDAFEIKGVDLSDAQMLKISKVIYGNQVTSVEITDVYRGLNRTMYNNETF